MNAPFVLVSGDTVTLKWGGWGGLSLKYFLTKIFRRAKKKKEKFKWILLSSLFFYRSVIDVQYFMLQVCSIVIHNF